jgi:hypothetical protein
MGFTPRGRSSGNICLKAYQLDGERKGGFPDLLSGKPLRRARRDAYRGSSFGIASSANLVTIPVLYGGVR